MLTVRSITDAKKTAPAEKAKSMALISRYLMAVTRETEGAYRTRDVRLTAEGATYDLERHELKSISLDDIAEIRRDLKEAGSEYGARAALHHRSRGVLQEVVTDMCTFGRGGVPGAAAKSVMATAAVSGVVGVVAEAAFGVGHYGYTFEQSAANFLLGTEQNPSLVPVVSGIAAAAIAGRVAVAFAAHPRTPEERKKFDDYSDIKHALVALKQLKKAVVSAKTPDFEKEDLPTLASVLKTRRQALRT